MNLLIYGGGGREHALAWKIAQSPRCSKLYCIPGNPGIADLAECVALEGVPLGDAAAPPAERWAGLVEWCRKHEIDLVAVGPERPLSEGIADALAAGGIKVFGPTAEGAQLESSKRFAKELMAEADIPTAAARMFTRYEDAAAYVRDSGAPCVIKASGLAEGKGVTVAQTVEEALAALSEAMCARRFGGAGDEVLVEEFLEGEEASLLAFADGHTVAPMESAQDHKPVFDGDCGPNTGGMGAYSPAPVVTPERHADCVRRILKPCLDALRRRGIHYCGVIYAGLIFTDDGPKVIEFNCRFGDPEIQALLPRLDSDLVEVMLACAEGRLDALELQWSDEAAVCVVAASDGYPGSYETGKPITGLEKLPQDDRVVCFHAGTRRNERGDVVTGGGRVFGLTVRDPSLRVAIERAYAWLDVVGFEGMHIRRDIGRKALDREG